MYLQTKKLTTIIPNAMSNLFLTFTIIIHHHYIQFAMPLLPYILTEFLHNNYKKYVTKDLSKDDVSLTSTSTLYFISKLL